MTQTTTATMSNSLSSSSFSTSAGEARSLPRPRINNDTRGAPSPDLAAAQPSLAAGSHSLRATPKKKKIKYDALWNTRYQELVDYKAQHGVSFAHIVLVTTLPCRLNKHFVLHTELPCTKRVQAEPQTW
jgi:hypothetical protein